LKGVIPLRNLDFCVALAGEAVGALAKMTERSTKPSHDALEEKQWHEKSSG
jgi:hypothetical protein